MSRIVLLMLWPVCLLASLVAALWMLAAIIFGAERRAVRLAISHDQLANAAFGGHEDETISSRAARARDNGHRWGCVLCKLLDRVDPDHCNKSRGI